MHNWKTGRQWAAVSRSIIANANDCSPKTEGQELLGMNSIE